MDEQQPMEQIEVSRARMWMKWGVLALIVIVVLAIIMVSGGSEEEPLGAEDVSGALPAEEVLVTESAVIPKGATVQVSIKNSAFIPETETIRVGDVIVWTNNEDRTPHSIVSDDEFFMSETLAAGERFEWQFTSPGMYEYHCGIHPNMRGTILVQ